MYSWNAYVYRALSPSESHWRLCSEFIDRYRRHLPEEQVVALAHSFASYKLEMHDEADQMQRLVWDQLPEGAELILKENSYWERDAEPEFPKLDVVKVTEKSVKPKVKPEPPEVVEISDDDATKEVASSNSESSKIK